MSVIQASLLDAPPTSTATATVRLFYSTISDLRDTFDGVMFTTARARAALNTPSCGKTQAWDLWKNVNGARAEFSRSGAKKIETPNDVSLGCGGADLPISSS